MDEKELERRVFKYLINVGIATHYKGFSYLQELLTLYLQQKDSHLYPLSSFGYKKVAEKFGVTAISVRQCINSAVKNIDTKKELFQEVFHVFWLSDKKISNSFFIHISLWELQYGNSKV